MTIYVAEIEGKAIAAFILAAASTGRRNTYLEQKR